MSTYTIRYSTGTSIHDERRFTRRLEAAGFAEAARRAEHIVGRIESSTLLSIELSKTVAPKSLVA